MREPPFWWRAPGIEAMALAPLAWVYGAVAGWRMNRSGRRVGVPVVCVGNPTVGGAGKTPLSLAVARMLQAEGEAVAFLSRGYGGQQADPVQVDPLQHRAVDVGDEPLLLARVAPTIVAHDRSAGASAAITAGAGVIVMDDGFQNPSLDKDFSVLVVDARRGTGNDRVIPAGPLRAPLAAQLARAHALVVVGKPSGELPVVAAARARQLPVFHARLDPDQSFVAALGGRSMLAFAGIGDPDKFFATLAEAGITVAATRGFPDHHRYTPAEVAMLCAQADRQGLELITTEKDLARIVRAPGAQPLAARAQALPVELVFEDTAGFRALLLGAIAAARGQG